MTETNIDSALDVFAHTNPAFVSAVVYWTATGYRENALKLGTTPELALPWCLVSVALVAPDGVRAALPETSGRRLSNLMADHPAWKTALPDAVRLWVPVFWTGLRYGVTKGTLRVAQGRISAAKRLKAPATPAAATLQKKSVTLGRVLANEGSDAAISLALGLEVQR